MKIVFAGTPAFAVPSLKALVESGHTVVGVLTQPDRPAGRGRQTAPGPVKSLADECAIPLFQPESLRGTDPQVLMRSFDADLMVVVAYGLILPAAILGIPRLGCINVHASLLPRWRGAAPIPRAILAGDEETGITIMQVEPKLDAGPMYLKRRCPIHSGETAGELHDRLADLGAEALLSTLTVLENGTAVAEVQDESLVTYAEKLSKHEATLDWSQAAVVLDRQVRAFNPWPVAETSLGDQTLRIWRAEVLAEACSAVPGSVLAGRKTWDVATGDGVLRLLEVQLPGRSRIRAEDYLNARKAPLRLGHRDAG